MKRNRNLTGVALAFAMLLLPLESLRAIPLPNPTAVVTSLQGEYLDGSGVLLQWRALAQSGQFNVQRSTDGVHYVTVGVVDVQGGHDAAYVYQDAEVAPGSYHYRLRNIVAEEPAGVSRSIALEVSPELATNQYLFSAAEAPTVTLRLDHSWQGREVGVEVTSRSGQPVSYFTYEVDDRVSVEVKDLAAGTYTVRVSDEDHTLTRHVVVP